LGFLSSFAIDRQEPKVRSNLCVTISAVEAQPWAPPKMMLTPLMVIYKKKVFDVMLHLEAEWPSK